MLRIGTLFRTTLSLTAVSFNRANAQKITDEPGSPSATTTTADTSPTRRRHPAGEVPTFDGLEPRWLGRVALPKVFGR